MCILPACCLAFGMYLSMFREVIQSICRSKYYFSLSESFPSRLWTFPLLSVQVTHACWVPGSSSVVQTSEDKTIRYGKILPLQLYKAGRARNGTSHRMDMWHLPLSGICHQFYLYKDNNVQFWLTRSESVDRLQVLSVRQYIKRYAFLAWWYKYILYLGCPLSVVIYILVLSMPVAHLLHKHLSSLLYGKSVDFLSVVFLFTGDTGNHYSTYYT